MFKIQLLTICLFAAVPGCGIVSEDECKADGGRWVCVDDAPGPQRSVCVCDDGDGDGSEQSEDEYGPDPLPW